MCDPGLPYVRQNAFDGTKESLVIAKIRILEVVLHNYFQHTEARDGVRQGFPQHEPEAEWALNIQTEGMNECVLQDSSSSFNANHRLDTTEFCCQNIWEIGLKNVYQDPSLQNSSELLII